ncbi:MAG: hypothetical protein WC943_14150 [Elusimicrobiota bacterium]|jgi:hypothetical protein
MTRELALLLFIYGPLMAVVALFLVFFLLAPVLGGPFVPTPHGQVQDAMRLARPRPGEIFVDLGSGDGRLLLAAASAGARAVGYEINPVLVLVSRLDLWWAGLSSRAEVRMRSYWPADLSDADVIAVYGITYLMPRLATKLLREAKPGCRVVSVDFEFSGWTPVWSCGSVHLYVPRPAGKAESSRA